MSRTSEITRGNAPVDGSVAALMIVLTLLWGFNQVAIKLSNEGFDPLFSVVVRSILGGALIYGWCLYRRISLFERDGTLWPGLLAGFFFGAEFALLFIGLDYTTASRSALLLNMMPFWVLIGGHFLLNERITGRKVGGLLLAFAGVILVFSDDLSMPDAGAIRGDIMCLIAGMMWAGINLTVKGSRLVNIRTEKTLLYQLAVSSIMLVPILPFAGSPLREISATASAALLYQAIVVVAVSYMVWFWLMRHYSASSLSSFVLLTPAFGVLSGGLILGEPLTWRIFAALALIMAGLFIVNRPARRAHPG